MTTKSKLEIFHWPHQPFAPGLLHTGSTQFEIVSAISRIGAEPLSHGGFYDRVNGWLLLLYRRENTLWLRATHGSEEIEVELDDHIGSEWSDGGRARLPARWLAMATPSRLRLIRDGKVLLELKYVRQNSDMPNDDLTIGRDTEIDDDFVLFLHMLLNDTDRRRRVVEALASEQPGT